MNYPRWQMYWQSKRLCWGGAPRQRAAGQENPELLCHMAHSHRFYDDEVSFLGFLRPLILTVPTFGPIQGPSCWHTHLSVKMFPSTSVLGRLAEHLMGWPLLPPFGSSWIIPVGRSLSVLCSLLGSPVVRSLMQAIVIMPGRVVQFWSMVLWHFYLVLHGLGIL